VASAPDVLIVGGGVIGCAVAYELAGHGLRVRLLERGGLCSGASGANGALIWPQAMKRGIGLDLSLLNFHRFSTLGEELGTDIGYDRSGGMVAVTDDAQWTRMEEYVGVQREVGLPAELLDIAEARRREPALNPRLRGALYAEHGGQVNPFRLTLGYARAARARGAVLTPGLEVTQLVRRGDGVVGARTPYGDIEAGHVVLAAGSWSPTLAATAGVRIPVVPRQGMMVVTEPAPFRIRHVLKPIKADADIWQFSQPWPPDGAGKPGYDPNLPPGKGMALGQTPTGNFLMGSTSRFVGFDLAPTANGVRYMLAHALQVVPALARVRVVRTWAGLRPYTPDGLPLLGRAAGVDGLILATGHDGGGVGNGPVSAQLVCSVITKCEPPLPLAPFDPARPGVS